MQVYVASPWDAMCSKSEPGSTVKCVFSCCHQLTEAPCGTLSAMAEAWLCLQAAAEKIHDRQAADKALLLEDRKRKGCACAMLANMRPGMQCVPVLTTEFAVQDPRRCPAVSLTLTVLELSKW